MSLRVFALAAISLALLSAVIDASREEPGSAADETTNDSKCLRYAVKAGQTCYSIAKENNIPLDSIFDSNPGIICNDLKIGQIICLPSEAYNLKPKVNDQPPPQPQQPTTPDCDGRGYLYLVRSGYSDCETIATINGVSVRDLNDFNSGLNCDQDLTGQYLCLPRPSQANQ